MSVSIYYTATRAKQLSAAEGEVIKTIEKRYSVSDQIDKYMSSGQGLNWEDFCFYNSDTETPEVVLEGSVKLPDNSDDAPLIGIQHWRACLNDLRRSLPDAEWHVHLDDMDFIWTQQGGWSLPGLE